MQWLTTLGQAHDVITDHDLHEEALRCSRRIASVIAAQHPEYYSERMQDAMEAYLGAGGRLMYLGGNGFYWRAEPSATDPHALEVRRAEGGIRVWATIPGESYHQFGGGYGGLWRRIGRSSHKLVGISFSSQGRHSGFPYRFVDGIKDPRVSFMTQGIDACLAACSVIAATWAAVRRASNSTASIRNTARRRTRSWWRRASSSIPSTGG